MRARLLTELLAARLRRSPDAPALRSGGRTLPYSGLDALSGRFAGALRAAGTRRGDRVALSLPKSAEAAAAVFGVLKAGACYVPLDPASPPLRQAAVLRDCGARVLIASSALLEKTGRVLAEGTPVRGVVRSDGDAGPGRLPGGRTRVISLPEAPREADRRGGRDACPEDLAYILYTSGSTGRPKGVAISHRASLAFVDWACDDLGIAERDVVCCPSPLHFDLSVLDLFATVRSGAAACPVPPGTGASPLSLAAFLARERISVLYGVPSTLTRLLSHGGLSERDLSPLRMVLYAGEPFPVQHLRRLMAVLPQARFFNLYGPTETNVCAWHPVRRLRPRAESVPIGRAASGARLAVLNEDLRPVSPGAVGELWVSGPSLMRGYWGAAAGERRVFAAPFGRKGKWYRTGDLVRADASGLHTFIGRTDNMVKIRGCRVELEEVERVLNACPGIAEGAAVAVPDPEAGRLLSAVLVSRSGIALTEDAVRAHCARHLPSYMIPESFLFRDSLPRDSRGKLDRTALLAGRNP